MTQINILFVGDLIGEPGRALFKKHVPILREKYDIGCVIVNGENAADNGRGITPSIVQELKSVGAHVITSGNHIADKNIIYAYLQDHEDLVRPANFSSDFPGRGAMVCTNAATPVGVINVQGRLFMRELSACPFRTVQSLLPFVQSKTGVVIVDFHAEATSEKAAMGYFLDGKVSAVMGTHTHVQTSDERILPGGTAVISDVGMCGALNSMIGMRKEIVLRTFLTQMPVRFEVDYEGPFVFNAVVVRVDVETGLAKSIERIYLVDGDLIVSPSGAH